MKILHLGKYYPPVFGGVENVNCELVEGLLDKGVETDVLCFNTNNKSIVEKSSGGLIYREASLFKLFSMSISFMYVYRFLKIRKKYDIISVHCPNPIAFFALLFSTSNNKIVLHWHSDIIKQEKLLKVFSPIQKIIINKADIVLGATLEHIKGSDCYPLFKDKWDILTYSFSPSGFVSDVNLNLYENVKSELKNKKIIFSLGRFVYYKGFDCLIKSAMHLPDDYIILIAGKGELCSEYRALISKFGLESKVKLLGALPYPDIKSYYKVCDVFCLPSTHRSEMFGIVQLEAMAFGKPVVATNIPRSGVPYVNINGVTGVNVDVNDRISLANALIDICDNKVISSDIDENIKSTLTKYDRSEVINKLIKIYCKVCKNE
ncbi:glycosyltransferase [Vibrio cyclitrophicus]